MTLSQLPPMTATDAKDIHPVDITTVYSFTPHNMPKVSSPASLHRFRVTTIRMN